MMKGNLLALLIYVMCGLEWSDDIEMYAKIRHWNKKLWVQEFRFKREKKDFTSIWSIYSNLMDIPQVSKETPKDVNM